MEPLVRYEPWSSDRHGFFMPQTELGMKCAKMLQPQ